MSKNTGPCVLICVLVFFSFASLSSHQIVPISWKIPSFSFDMSQSDTTWEIVNHGFESEDAIMSDVAFINTTHGWVTGQNETGLGNGIILHTTDGGITWQLQLYNTSQEFRSIEIIDEQTLYITCWYGLVLTEDGGQTWEYISIIQQRAIFGDVVFTNATHGWTGSAGDLYSTVDGGLTWQNVTSWSFDDTPRSITMQSESEIWVIGFYGIYHTENGGLDWTKTHQFGGWDFTFISDVEAWAVGDNMLVHMTDGETWVVRPNPRPSRHDPQRPPYYTDIEFIDANHGWIVGLETPVAHTPDAGENWYAQSVPEEFDQRVLAVDFVDQTHGWVVCWDGIIMRTETGDALGTLLTSGDTTSLLLILGFGGIAVVLGVLAVYIRKRKTKSLSLEIH